jgi:small-conductance mechanosensitive channel
MVSRLALNTSYLGARCLVASSNHQLVNFTYQSNRHLSHHKSSKRPPGRIRRFFRWFGWGAEPIISTLPPPPPPATAMQRIKRFFLISPSIERFLLRSHIIEDEDLARLLSKTAAITIYAMITVSTLGTLGVDTKPLLAGIGITGFTIGFALKEVATNFISGIFLVINKPFVRGCRIKIHGSGGGIEGKIEVFFFEHLFEIKSEKVWFILLMSDMFI